MPYKIKMFVTNFLNSFMAPILDALSAIVSFALALNLDDYIYTFLVIVILIFIFFCKHLAFQNTDLKNRISQISITKSNFPYRIADMVSKTNEDGYSIFIYINCLKPMEYNPHLIIEFEDRYSKPDLINSEKEVTHRFILDNINEYTINFDTRLFNKTYFEYHFVIQEAIPISNVKIKIVDNKNNLIADFYLNE